MEPRQTRNVIIMLAMGVALLATQVLGIGLGALPMLLAIVVLCAGAGVAARHISRKIGYPVAVICLVGGASSYVLLTMNAAEGLAGLADALLAGVIMLFLVLPGTVLLVSMVIVDVWRRTRADPPA